MDGWESRRKRTSGHDYIILKLGKPGKISKIDVDTSHFNGNQPSMVSIEGANSSSNKIRACLAFLIFQINFYIAREFQ